MSRQVIITDDSETFTPSDCQCPFCVSTHTAVAEWRGFTPQTHLQRGMMAVVARIEDRYVRKHVTQNRAKRRRL